MEYYLFGNEDMLRRVVVTGLGLVTPLGCGVDTVWSRLLDKKSGIKKVTHIDVSDIKAQIGGLVPCGEGVGDYNADAYTSKKERNRMDPFMEYAIVAADEALADSGWEATNDEMRNRAGVLIGSGIGGLHSIEKGTTALRDVGPRRVSPFFIPATLINLAAGHVSIRHDLRGPNHAVVTACTSGAHALGDAARMVALGDADMMVAGGAEAGINRLGLAGFASARALSIKFNDRPTEASRPFDRDRDGFVMGDGSGIVVMEDLESAIKRGAKIYGEIVGYGMSGDAHHITAPPADGNGGYRAMQAAIKRAGINIDDIDYVNAHGTSTPLGDNIEIGAIKRLFGEDIKDVAISSTKSSIGHLLGAAGAVEGIFSLLSIDNNIVPATLNLHNPDDTCEGVNLVALEPQEKKINVVMSNSFGFGGTNASLIFKSYDG